MLHQLAARAVIAEWEDGYLSRDRQRHELLKKSRHNHVLALSLRYSVVTKLTSFIAVERREEGEETRTDIPPLEGIMRAVADVDILPYMGWEQQEEQGEDKVGGEGGFH